MPSVAVEPGVYGTYTHLRAIVSGYLVDETGVAYGCTVDAYLVGSGIEKPVNIFQFVDSSSHGERYVDLLGYSCHHVGKGLSPFKAGCDVEKHEFVGSCIAVGLAQFHGVACAAEVHEVCALYGFSVLHVKAGYDSLSQTFAYVLFNHISFFFFIIAEISLWGTQRPNLSMSIFPS